MLSPDSVQNQNNKDNENRKLRSNRNKNAADGRQTNVQIDGERSFVAELAALQRRGIALVGALVGGLDLVDLQRP